MASSIISNALSAPQHVLDLLDRLHKLSWEQEEKLLAPGGGYGKIKDWAKSDPQHVEDKRNELMLDKFIALDTDKASLVYSLIRAMGALNVVEAGTSFGVSTIYLALAVGQNAKAVGKGPEAARVIATEFEPSKAEKARGYWKEAGESVEPWIDLREGDILQTLKTDVPTVDFVLFDIWTPVVVPTLKLLEPHFRPGTILVVDNTVSSREGYADLFDHIKNAGGKYRTLTLPFDRGLEMITYWPNAE